MDCFKTAQQIVFKAFEQGITHFDLANNYGPPPGSAETNFGRILKNVLAAQRGQTLAEMSLAWLLAKKQITSVIIGASSTKQLLDNIATTNCITFTEDELKQIDAILL